MLRPTAGHVRALVMDPLADHRRVAQELGHLPGELRLHPELTGAQTLDLLCSLQGRRCTRRPSRASGWN
ncbi:hypothetical protein [Streptomyces goshikiensis]|uniref:hypothetical protein n=1 Tax=Streptomyces goshikiensis TaxID=1942 RepID=UPI00371557E9